MAFIHVGKVAKDTAKYIDDRRKGIITSCKTGKPKLDTALLGGIEWGSTVSIGGRPSVGKTIYSSDIIRGIFESNPIEDLEVLDFSWEMSGRSLIIRELSSKVKKTYGDILSVDPEKKINDSEMSDISDILVEYDNIPWFIEEDPKSAREFENIVTKRVEANPKKKRIVRIDHSVLAKQAADEKSQVEMLQNLLNVCTKLKKQSDIIFIPLTQLNREFETRQQDGTNEAYPKQSDCFGGDAVAQSSDVVILLNRPSKYGITYYGKRPGGRQIDYPDLIFAHVVKSRNSSPDLTLVYRAKFEEMKFIEL